MIHVESEFAKLRSVVLAESEFGYPMTPRLGDLRFLSNDPIQESMIHAGKDLLRLFQINRYFGNLKGCA
jgi:hypothetical protein